MRRSAIPLVVAACWTVALCECGGSSSSEPGSDGGNDASSDGSPDVVIVLPEDAGADSSTHDAGCSAPTTLDCNGTCVDPTLPANCGTCGNDCAGPDAGPGHAVCLPGNQCAVACDTDGGPTEILCGGACVSPDDPAHCGAGCMACPGPPSGNGSAACPAAQCTVTCAAGYHPGGANCSSDCLANGDEPSTDPCVVADGLGVFVSPTGSDTTGDGSKEHPFGTINHAMVMASAGAKRVYACGTFTDADQVVNVSSTLDGVAVYGGFDCTTWAYSATTPTKVAPSVAGYALQVVNISTTGVTFEDFEFDSISAPATPSATPASSIAVFVSGSTVTLTRVAVNAGSGQPGLSGVTAADWSGANTMTGGPAGATGGGGAAGPVNSCTDATTSQGGTGAVYDGAAGQPGLANGVALTENGGATAANSCTGGTQGSPGANAPAVGNGTTSSGTVTSVGWAINGAGGAGQNGAPGQGGGGGGANDSATLGVGGGGGGGGSGGCGGGEGTGGYSGGSSIGLVSFQCVVVLAGASITTAAGGTGGMGGPGQDGQSGAGGGAGACTGGTGGTGGNGSGGGGGAGGLSSGIVWTGTTAPSVNGASVSSQATVTGITLGAQGAGGNGTGTILPGGPGATPTAMAVLELP